MSAYKEFSGKSVEEALRSAREEFGVELSDLDFEILTPGSRGVLGMGAEPARIVAAPRSALGGAAPKREAAAATPLPAPPPVRAQPPGDAAEPRAELRRVFQPRQLPQGPQQRFLDQVLGIDRATGPVRKPAVSPALQTRKVARAQFVQRGAVPGSGPKHEVEGRIRAWSARGLTFPRMSVRRWRQRTHLG
jgi:predicted RNA-binding protein Jag